MESTVVVGAGSAGERGDHVEAGASLFVQVYDQLYAIAASALRRERRGHTLQPTALVHEVYLRLGEQPTRWNDTAHFLAVASAAIRRVLVDHARARLTLKRGSCDQRVVPSGESAGTGQRWDDWVDLDEALTRLEALDARRGRVVALKVFGGMTNDRIAQLLCVSRATVANDWTFARAWLSRELGADGR
jgi:RNA polymerase sigma factor (TIGR02999 family)